MVINVEMKMKKNGLLTFLRLKNGDDKLNSDARKKSKNSKNPNFVVSEVSLKPYEYFQNSHANS